MKTSFALLAVASLVSFGLTIVAGKATAQGPAGAGASQAAQESSHGSHSLNPIKWVKKDSKPSAEGRADIEKKLTPKLQAEGLISVKTTATQACDPFTSLQDCVASLHASRNLDLDFNCVRAGVTGVHSNADLSGCNGSVGEKAQDLRKTIHMLKPDANAKDAAKTAEQQAKDDMKNLG